MPRIWLDSDSNINPFLKAPWEISICNTTDKHCLKKWQGPEIDKNLAENLEKVWLSQYGRH